MPKKSITMLYALLTLVLLPIVARAGVDTPVAVAGNVVAPLGQGGTYSLFLPAPPGPAPYQVQVQGGPRGITVSAPTGLRGTVQGRITVPPSTPAGAWPLRLTVRAANGQERVSRGWLLVDGLFVTLAGKHPQVLAYSPTGKPVPMPGAFVGLIHPMDMAYRARDNTLYVADVGQDIAGGSPGGIRVFSNTGAPAVSAFAGINRPTVITDDDGHFLVAGDSGSNWWIMNDAGLVIGQSGVGSPVFSGWNSSPQGIASAQGRVYVPWGEGYPSGVRVYTLNGHRIRMPGAFPDTGGTEQHMDTPMASPNGVAWSPRRRLVYVMYRIDHTRSRLAIRAYGPQGQPVAMAGGFPDLGGWSSVRHLANQLTASAITGDVYAISGHHTVNIYSPDGRSLGAFPVPAAATSVLAVPYGWQGDAAASDTQSNGIPMARTEPAACPPGYTCIPAQRATNASATPIHKHVSRGSGNVVQDATNQVSTVSNLAWSISNLANALP
ncbi:hypothetical protein [Acidithiobacillus sp.]|uniref:hypothetical protein n=1 Tax=Acidithiobacillus sp. TaxID=1872118 RepID=UPI00260CFAB7|nr:hypothetical protein [Acidithiobacillus sp.]